MLNNDTIGKRINFDEKNIKRVNIMTTLFENETKGMNAKQKMDFIVNKSIKEYYASSGIKSKLDL